MSGKRDSKAAVTLDAMQGKLAEVIKTFTAARPPSMSLDTFHRVLADMHQQQYALRMGAHALRFKHDVCTDPDCVLCFSVEDEVSVS
jgi:hypothetical protein